MSFKRTLGKAFVSADYWYTKQSLGNMSNPSINRWGLNLFWYRFWYVDKNINLLISQDDLINKLIMLYIQYGILSNKNFFISNYWYSNLDNLIKTHSTESNSKYFRVVEYKNKVINENRFYKIRTKIKNLYFSKLWIFRYQNWLIINLYSYQPVKKKTARTRRLGKDLNFYLPEFRTDSEKTYIRSKLYFFFFINSLLSKNLYYKF